MCQMAHARPSAGTGAPGVCPHPMCTELSVGECGACLEGPKRPGWLAAGLGVGQDPMSKRLCGTLWPDKASWTPHSHLSQPRGAKSTHFHSSKNMCPTPQYLAQEGEMGAPGGGLKQCAQGRGQDRTSVGSPHMPKATFPFVTARQWVDGWRLFFLNTATVSAGHSQLCSRGPVGSKPPPHRCPPPTTRHLQQLISSRPT